MKTLGLVVVMVGAVLASAEVVGCGPESAGSCCELAKLELWGKASLGFVRKSATTWDGGLRLEDTGLLEVSRTTRVSTFSTAETPLKASEAGRVEDLAEGLGGKFVKEGEVEGGDLRQSVVSTASLMDVTLSTLFVSLGELSSC